MAQPRSEPCPPHPKIPESMINWYICKKKKDDEERDANGNSHRQQQLWATFSPLIICPLKSWAGKTPFWGHTSCQCTFSASYLQADPRAQRMEWIGYCTVSLSPLPSILQRKNGQQINSKGWWEREAYQSTLSLSDLPWNPPRDCQKLVPVLKSLQWPFRKRSELRSQLHHKASAFCRLNSRCKQMFSPAAHANPIIHVRQYQHTVQF